MSKTAILEYDGKKYEFPVIVGSENEPAIDINKLRDLTGAITLDPGYKNSGSCKSEITFLDGEEGILRYRGYAIEDLADKAFQNDKCDAVYMTSMRARKAAMAGSTKYKPGCC